MSFEERTAPEWADLSPGTDGLVPAIVQDREGRVRMLASMNEDAFRRTIESGLVTFWSRSRQELWTKGETSGNTLALVGVAADCDGDVLLVTTDPAGPSCHTGQDTCFGAPETRFGFLETLWSVIEARVEERPPGSNTTALLDGGPDRTARKVVEEATEVLIAAKNHAAGIDDDQRLAEEAADLVYHLLVTLAERGIDPSLVTTELRRRNGPPTLG